MIISTYLGINSSGGRWLCEDDFWPFDADLAAPSRKGDQLGIWIPTVDNRDAIVGGRFVPVLPDQQYGARASLWIARRGIAAEAARAESDRRYADAEPF